MHNNYHYLRLLTPVLEKKIIGSVVSECFTQAKDELIIRFETTDNPFFIRSSLSPSFACLSFPGEYNRARKNSTDLFEILVGQRVLSIRQFSYERSFLVQLTDNNSLMFKMHGNRSNVVLFNDDKVVDLFKKSILADRQLTLEGNDRNVDWSLKNFELSHHQLPQLYFTFGKIPWRYLQVHGFFEKPLDAKWKMITEMLSELEHPKYFICQLDGRLVFSLLSVGDVVRANNDPIKAINDFYLLHIQKDGISHQKSELVSVLRKRSAHARQVYQKALERLAALESQNNYKIWADLLMANLHIIAPGQQSVTLPDFYNENSHIEIKLKRALTPQKNAEAFYSKSKKQLVEIIHLKELITQKTALIQTAEHSLEVLDKIKDLKTLRLFAEQNQLATGQKKEEPLPFHEFDHEGFRIFVGKNAQSNDKLLQRFSYKEDLWLHAKDVAGSHVLIKYQAGKAFPKTVIERAASLAAFNSKRKSETLCPVVVTPRKYVRKRKGDPAGTVIVEREQVILVEPRQ